MDRFDDLLATATRLDLTALEQKVEGFSAPQQQRALQKTQRILAATATLLDNHAFGDISIADIARKADCSMATIYSRFESKNALIPIVYLLVRRHYTASLDRSRPFKGRDLLEFCKAIAQFSENWFTDNKNLERIFVSYYDNVIRTLVAEMDVKFCHQINPRVAEFLQCDPVTSLSSVALALNVNMTMYRDGCLITPRSGELNFPDADQMARLMALIIRSSQGAERVAV